MLLFCCFVCSKKESVSWPFIHLVRSFFSFSQRNRSSVLAGLWEIPSARKRSTHTTLSLFLRQHAVESGLLPAVYCWCQSMLEAREWVQKEAACQVGGNGVRQINCSQAPWSVRCVQSVTTPTTDSSVPSCYWLATITPEAGERSGPRRERVGSCVLTRSVWESYTDFSIVMAWIKRLPSRGLKTGHEG